MNKTILAYAAGFFDGEGTVGINAQKPNVKNGRTLTMYSLKIDIRNTNEDVLLWLKKNFNGNIKYYSIEKLKGSYGATKPQWRWNISSNQAKDFLELILPYLVVKRKQAELAIIFQKNRKDLLNKEKPYQLIEIERRELYKREISKLNR